MDDRERLLKRLKDAGCSDIELERAGSDGRIPTLAVEHALGCTELHTLTGITRAAKLDPAFARELMQAVGRSRPAPPARVFTDDDIEIAKLSAAFSTPAFRAPSCSRSPGS